MALPAISWGTVGHRTPADEGPDDTIAFWFIRGSQAYVECTLEPGGGHIVARVNMDGGYEVLSFGDRVVLMHCNGDPNSSVIVGKLHDDGDPLPASLAGGSIPTDGPVFDPDTNARFARRVQFIQATPDSVLVLETRGAGDLILHSSAGMALRAPSGYVLIDGQHIVLGEGPAVAPTPALVTGDASTPGAAFLPPESPPLVNATSPSYEGFADGVVRAKDRYQATPAIDPVFFTHQTALETLVLAVAAVPLISAATAPAVAAYQLVPKPDGITSAAMSASQDVEVRG